MNEDDYYYCLAHKKSILPEDKAGHDFHDCQFIIVTCRISTPVKIRKHWAAKTIADKYGMKVFTLPKKRKQGQVFTLPSNAVILEVKAEGIDLSQTKKIN